MKSKIAKMLALLLAALMVLSACGGNTNSDASDNTDDSSSNVGLTEIEVDENLTQEEQLESLKVDNEGTALTTYRTYQTQSSEMENFLIQHTEKSVDLNVLCNCYAFLLEVNNYGKLTRGAAETYDVSDDNSVWTFHLASGQKWVDYQGNVKADLVAQDYVTSIEWILNSHKNEGYNTSMLVNMLEGAQDYYDYTSSLSEEEALALTTDNEEFQKVGVKAPDDSTVVYTLTGGYTYFGTLATSAALAPLSQGEIDEVGVSNMIGRDYTRMWYSGAYYISEYFASNSKTLIKNPYYWDPDSTFETVTITMVESAAKANEMFFNGELDHATLTDDNLTQILNNPDHEWYNYLVPTRKAKYSYCWVFNFHKFINQGTTASPDYVEDVNWNTAISNEAFRKSLYYGVDFYEYMALANPLDPGSMEDLCYTMEGVCFFSDGTDYIERVKELIGLDGEREGDSLLRVNADEAEKYKQQAIEELTAQGVTFPVQIDYWVSNSTTAMQSAQIMKECVEDLLGTDYVTLQINNYTNSSSTEVYSPKLQSFYFGGWGADYGDVENFTDQAEIGGYYDGKYMNVSESGQDEVIALFQEFTDMAEAAKAITSDIDERYEAFAQAEAFLLNHVLILPARYSQSWQLTHVNTYSMINGLYGCQNYLYKNYETSTNPYTAEEMSKFAAAYELQR